MVLTYILFVLGIILLIKGAHYLVEGASSLAKRMRVPTLIIGITVVSIGTTMPELIVNVLANLRGASEIAFGNILGSIIANIFLVLGVTAIIRPIKVERNSVTKEIPIALFAVIVLFIIANSMTIDQTTTNTLTRTNGAIMILFFLVFLYYSIEVFRQSRKKLQDQAIGIDARPLSISILMMLVGVIGLFFGGEWTVNGAVVIARQFGLSEFLISSTIIALGTSLPELMTGITAARKNETGIVVGNVAGANIFNVFWILGVSALIAPIAVPSFINTDTAIACIATLMLLGSIFLGKKGEIERWQGITFILLYIAYLAFIVIRG